MAEEQKQERPERRPRSRRGPGKKKSEQSQADSSQQPSTVKEQGPTRPDLRQILDKYGPILFEGVKILQELRTPPSHSEHIHELDSRLREVERHKQSVEDRLDQHDERLRETGHELSNISRSLYGQRTTGIITLLVVIFGIVLLLFR